MRILILGITICFFLFSNLSEVWSSKCFKGIEKTKPWKKMKIKGLRRWRCALLAKDLHFMCLIQKNTKACRKKSSAMYKVCARKKQRYNSCKNIACNNHGLCLPLSSKTFFCDCNPGWRGKLCKEKISPCENYFCGEHGECKVVKGKPKCKCDRQNGWFGKKCQYRDLTKIYSEIGKRPKQIIINYCSNKQKAPQNDPEKCPKEIKIGIIFLINKLWWVLALFTFAFVTPIFAFILFKRNIAEEHVILIQDLQKRVSDKGKEIEGYVKTNTKLVEEIIWLKKQLCLTDGEDTLALKSDQIDDNLPEPEEVEEIIEPFFKTSSKE